MSTRPPFRWLSPDVLRRLRDAAASLWLLPCVLALGGAALGLALTEPGWAPRVGALADAVSRDAAAGLLAAAAAAVAALLAVGFSIATVTVQLAASQYSPRLLRRFMGDRPTRYVLGVYAGALSYLLVALRGIRSPGAQGDAAAGDAVAGGAVMAASPSRSCAWRCCPTSCTT